MIVEHLMKPPEQKKNQEPISQVHGLPKPSLVSARAGAGCAE